MSPSTWLQPQLRCSGRLAFLSSLSQSLIPQTFSSPHGLSFTSDFFIRLLDSKDVKYKLAGLIRPWPRPGKFYFCHILSVKASHRVGRIQEVGDQHVCTGRGRIVGDHLWKQFTPLALITFVEWKYMALKKEYAWQKKIG